MSTRLKYVLACYDFVEAKIETEAISDETNRQPHVWTVNDDYLLRMSENLEELKRHIHLSKLLKTVNVKTQTPIQTVNHEDYVVMDGYYFILCEKIKGSVLTDYFIADEAKLGYELGQHLATLHEGLKEITPKLTDLWDNDMLQELSGWVSEELETYVSASTLPKTELTELKNIKNTCINHFKELYNNLPRQAIHRDFHGANIIFNDNEIVGYIDFDLTQLNARLFDVCYLGTGALASIFQEEAKRDRWSIFFKQVIKGYDEVTILTFEEKQMIKPMMIAIDLIMIAFFVQGGYKELADTNTRMINWIENTWSGELGAV